MAVLADTFDGTISKEGRTALVVAFKAYQVEHAALCKVATAFDAWYLESSHLCELVDALKSNPELRRQVELLHNLLTASIQLNAIQNP